MDLKEDEEVKRRLVGEKNHLKTRDVGSSAGPLQRLGEERVLGRVGQIEGVAEEEGEDQGSGGGGFGMRPGDWGVLV